MIAGNSLSRCPRWLTDQLLGAVLLGINSTGISLIHSLNKSVATPGLESFVDVVNLREELGLPLKLAFISGLLYPTQMAYVVMDAVPSLLYLLLMPVTQPDQAVHSGLLPPSHVDPAKSLGVVRGGRLHPDSHRGLDVGTTAIRAAHVSVPHANRHRYLAPALWVLADFSQLARPGGPTKLPRSPLSSSGGQQCHEPDLGHLDHGATDPDGLATTIERQEERYRTCSPIEQIQGLRLKTVDSGSDVHLPAGHHRDRCDAGSFDPGHPRRPTVHYGAHQLPERRRGHHLVVPHRAVPGFHLRQSPGGCRFLAVDSKTTESHLPQYGGLRSPGGPALSPWEHGSAKKEDGDHSDG